MIYFFGYNYSKIVYKIVNICKLLGMKIFIPTLSGFCPGVKHAEQKIFQEKQEHGDRPIFVFGYMINNRNYIDYLEQEGIHTTEQPWNLPENASVVIRTHGIDRNIEKRLEEKYNVIDLTCKNVKKVQLRILDESENGAFIVITGKKSHPEIMGLLSYAEHFQVLENMDDLTVFTGSLKRQPDQVLESCPRIFITSQTTGETSFFIKTVRAIDTVIKQKKNISYFNSICPITTSKEKEALDIQKRTDITFVLGDNLSSNANKLFRKLKTADCNTYMIQDLSSLKNTDIDLQAIKTAQVVSSASTPKFVEKEVVEYLSRVNPSD